jgi:hypothetical protein
MNAHMFAAMIDAINRVIENDDDERDGYVYPALAQDMAEAARLVYNSCLIGQEYEHRQRPTSNPKVGQE